MVIRTIFTSRFTKDLTYNTHINWTKVDCHSICESFQPRLDFDKVCFGHRSGTINYHHQINRALACWKINYDFLSQITCIFQTSTFLNVELFLSIIAVLLDMLNYFDYCWNKFFLKYIVLVICLFLKNLYKIKFNKKNLLFMQAGANI